MRSLRTNASIASILNLTVFAVIGTVGGYFFIQTMKPGGGQSLSRIGQIINQSGQVEMKMSRSQGWVPAPQDAAVFDRTAVHTGAQSTASIRIRATTLEVGEKTLVQVQDPDRQAEFSLDFGTFSLAAKKKERVTLKIGGEKIKLDLDSSTVKVEKDRNSDRVKLTSVMGAIRIESEDGKNIEVLAGQQVELTVPPQNQVEDAPPRQFAINLNESSVSDSNFRRRPQLNVSISPALQDVEFEVSANGTEWSPVEQGRFLPEQDGTYWIRMNGRDPESKDFIHETTSWVAGADRFEFGQPELVGSQFDVDPTRRSLRSVFKKFDFSEAQIEFSLGSGKTHSTMVKGMLDVADIPAGATGVSVKTVKSSRFSFEAKTSRFEIRVAAPALSQQKGTVKLKKIILPQYYYEALIGRRQAVAVDGGTEVTPSCSEECTLSVRYRSRSNPEWTSEFSEIKIDRVFMPRRIAQVGENEPARPSSPNAEETRLEPLRENGWRFEAGLGGNYLDMESSSSLTQMKSGGLSGPTVFLSAERSYEDVHWKALLLDIRSKMTTVSDTGQQEQNLNWRSIWVGGSYSGFRGFPRLEYGFSYQDVPIFYQGADGRGMFATGRVFSASAGFNAFWKVGPGVVEWDQRFLMPLNSVTGDHVEEFKVKFGIDGTLGYYQCLNDRWSAGVSWFGQYIQAQESFASGVTLLSDATSSRMLNSNFQVRFRYGICAASPNR